MPLRTIPSAAEEVRALADLDPEYKTRLDARGVLPRLGTPIDTNRAAIHAAIESGRSPLPDSVTYSSETVLVHSEHPRNVIIYAPRKPPKNRLPVAILIHGGGLVLGLPIMEEQTCIDLVENLGIICMAITYRLAPQFKYPTAVEDVWETVGAILEAPRMMHYAADPRLGFIVGGTSSGAKLTDILVHRSRDEPLNYPITGALELIPSLIDTSVVPERWQDLYLSWEQNKDADMLCRSEIEFYTRLYEPDVASVRESPLLDPKGHEGLPPIALQICGYDPLRDDGLIYGRLLQDLEKEGKAKVRISIWPGLPHGFHVLEPTLAASEQFRTEIRENVRWLLGR